MQTDRVCADRSFRFFSVNAAIFAKTHLFREQPSLRRNENSFAVNNNWANLAVFFLVKLLLYSGAGGSLSYKSYPVGQIWLTGPCQPFSPKSLVFRSEV